MTYTTEAIACGLSDVAGWLENEGLVLVPREPTPEMLKAAWDAYAAHEWDLGRAKRGPERDSLPIAWQALIAAAPVAGAEGEKPRDRIASVRLIPWEPDSQGGALITFDSGFKVAVPLYPLEGSARVTIKPAPSHPGEADRVGLGELADSYVQRVAEWDDRTSPEDWPEAMLITGDELKRELLAFTAEAGHLVPASLAALGTGEGSGGALIVEARAALARMKEREGEDIDEWAKRLAADSARMGEAEYHAPQSLPHPQAPNTLSDADQDAGLREEIARAGFAGWYGRDEYDEHPVQGMWERAADAIMRGPLATLRARATAAEDKLRDREAAVDAALDDACRMSSILLMAGEMTAQERRTARAVALGLAWRVRAALASTEHPASSEEATDVSGS